MPSESGFTQLVADLEEHIRQTGSEEMRLSFDALKKVYHTEAKLMKAFGYGQVLAVDFGTSKR